MELRRGANLRAITNDGITVPAHSSACIWLKYHERKRNWQPTVIWLYGPPGLGKTRIAYDFFGTDDTWECMETLKNWEGYDAHTTIIIDDFCDETCSYNQLLHILDRYPFRVNQKYGSRQLLAETIVITSEFHPRYVYPKSRRDPYAIVRRCNLILEISSPHSLCPGHRSERSRSGSAQVRSEMWSEAEQIVEDVACGSGSEATISSPPGFIETCDE